MKSASAPRSSSLPRTTGGVSSRPLEANAETKRVAAEDERRARLTRDIMDGTGITEGMIERLVGEYRRIQGDALLGPIFATRIADWEAHIAKLCAFWSSVALMSRRYHGQPMQAHLDLPVNSSHFDHWLGLFECTATELCPPAAAAHFIERARRIADSIELGMATRPVEIGSARYGRAPDLAAGKTHGGTGSQAIPILSSRGAS